MTSSVFFKADVDSRPVHRIHIKVDRKRRGIANVGYVIIEMKQLITE